MAPPAEEARELIAQLAVTLRRFVHAAGALEATLLLDQGAELPALVVECPAVGPVLLAEGEEVVQLDADRLAAEPLPLPEVKALPPFEVDAERAQITSLIGGVEHHARAVRALAELFPGRSVLSVQFPTTDVETPLTIAARAGEPVVLALGEETFELPL
ncbi:MAG: hypothetical protein JSS99_13925 [Actinobacteria bacterium]|nr:hypothetical protein [Actinomycetota bacterium]